MKKASADVQLVILAAGMGSRFGGLKQMAGIGIRGEWLLEFALYDAYQAGIRRLVLIVQESMVQALQEQLLPQIESCFEVRLAIQSKDRLPEPILALKNVERAKPWGTAHALWCAKEAIDSDFIVMNADDYYGASCFFQLLDATNTPNGLLGFPLKNTLSDYGTVTRGLLNVDSEGNLQGIEERHNLRASDLSEQALEQLVSMNMWYLKHDWVAMMEAYMVHVLKRGLENHELVKAAECYLPEAIGFHLGGPETQIQVVPAIDPWFGVTHKEDQEFARASLSNLQEKGLYPIPIWRKEEQ